MSFYPTTSLGSRLKTLITSSEPNLPESSVFSQWYLTINLVGHSQHSRKTGEKEYDPDV